MIAFEIGFVIIVGVLIAGPLLYFGMRRYLRWMSRMAEAEERRDQEMQ